MNGELEDRGEIRRAKARYFKQLTSLIGYRQQKMDGRDYSKLLEYLHERDFDPHCPHDENRMTDGLHLRNDAGVVDYIIERCSLLEMLAAFAKRINDDIIEKSPAKWFWEMMDNCGLSQFDNDHWSEPDVHYLVSVMNYRGYAPDGSGGGLFPLKNPQKDQRTVELWYQMQAYVIENYEI